MTFFKTQTGPQLTTSINTINHSSMEMCLAAVGWRLFAFSTPPPKPPPLLLLVGSSRAPKIAQSLTVVVFYRFFGVGGGGLHPKLTHKWQ